MRASLLPGASERVAFHVQTDNDVDRVLWYETVRGTPPAPPDRLDAAAIALVPRAMHGGQDLHLEGPVSWTLLANLEEFVECWAAWKPDLFRPVRITAEEVVDDRASGAGALAATAVIAYSGGVDSSYALVANETVRGWRSADVVAGIQVHGFDIHVDDHRAFARTLASSAPVLDAFDVEQVGVGTNWHAELCPDWEYTFFAGLASVLHLFSDRAGLALVAPDNAYDAPRIPWGSNPVTNPMLASNRFDFAFPGGAHARYEKCAAIGAVPAIRANLRVCWEGSTPGGNCGECEKCIRTKLNFLAAGHGTLEALGPVTVDQIREVTIGSPVVAAGYRLMVEPVTAIDPKLGAVLAEVVESEIRRLEVER